MQGITLTEYGRAFWARATLADAELSRAQEEIAQMLGAKGGTVAIGLSPVASLLLATDAITSFWKARPDATIRVVEGLFDQLLSAVLHGTLDFAIGPLPQTTNSGIEIERLFENRIVPVVRANHPLARCRSLDSLQGCGWLLTSSDAGYREMIIGNFKSHGFPQPRIAIVCESFPGFLELLSQTDLVAALPASILGHSLVRGHVVEIAVKERMPTTVMGLVHRGQIPLTPVAGQLAAQFSRSGRRYVARNAAR
jgi:LysR family transcriptional regulator of abg operon